MMFQIRVFLNDVFHSIYFYIIPKFSFLYDIKRLIILIKFKNAIFFPMKFIIHQFKWNSIKLMFLMKFHFYIINRAPLYTAVSLGNVEIVKLLLSNKNIDVNIIKVFKLK